MCELPIKSPVTNNRRFDVELRINRGDRVHSGYTIAIISADTS